LEQLDEEVNPVLKFVRNADLQVTPQQGKQSHGHLLTAAHEVPGKKGCAQDVRPAHIPFPVKPATRR
jgi:hypothetical protein